MKSFLAVLQREIAEQRRVFAVAGVLGIVPFFTPLLLGVAAEARSDTHVTMALFLAIGVTACLSLFLGGSVFASDLAERRLGFYFARPIPGWAIWAGKLTGALVLTFAAGAVILLPTLLLGKHLRTSFQLFGGGMRPALLWAGAFYLAFLLASHAVSTMVRSRSRWLVLDLSGASLIIVLVLSLRTRFLLEGVSSWWIAGSPWLLAGLLLALIVATAMQIILGRSDLRRGHRWMSLTLWGLLLGILLAMSAAAARILEVSPADLAQIQRVAPAPAGHWISFSGPDVHNPTRQPLFLLDTASGRFFRIRMPGFLSLDASSLWNLPLFSADGRWAVWQEVGDSFVPILARLDLTRPGAEPVRIPMNGFARAYSLSPDGSRLALLQDNRLLVEETATGRLIESLPYSSGSLQFDDREAVRFLDSGRLRLYQVRAVREKGNRAEKMVISEADLATRRIEQTGTLPIGMFLFFSTPVFSPDGERLLLTANGFAQVFDSRTGALLSEMLPRKGDGETVFLADGRIARALATAQARELQIYDRDGVAEVRRLSLPGARTMVLGGQPTPGLITVGIHPGNPFTEPADWRSLLLDLETGRLQELGKGLVPAGDPALPPGSFGSRLFVRDGNRLVSIDLATGQEKKIAGR